MDLVFITDIRFVKSVDQKIYSLDSASTNVLWERYLKEFDRITIMARVQENFSHAISDEFIVSNERVSFVELPYYIGPKEYIGVYFSFKKKIENNIIPGKAYICRWGQVASIAYKKLQKEGIPYAVEVVGDPYDVFAPGAFKHFLRPFFRYIGYIGLRRIVKSASAVLYVTKYKLQKRYPASCNSFKVDVSDVILPSICISDSPKTISRKEIYDIISVGSLAQMYKAPDIVLKAIHILKSQGIYVRLTWLGDGKYKEDMLALSVELAITDRIDFVGQVSTGELVRSYLSKADIFVLASRTEGLPRALVEAMAMGLPCIATEVGGIPELLANDVLVKPNDAQLLATKIKYMIDNPAFTNKCARDNLKESYEYSDDLLSKKRAVFYEKIKKMY